MIVRAAAITNFMMANAVATAASATTADQEIRTQIGKWIADFNRDGMTS